MDGRLEEGDFVRFVQPLEAKTPCVQEKLGKKISNRQFPKDFFVGFFSPPFCKLSMLVLICCRRKGMHGRILKKMQRGVNSTAGNTRPKADYVVEVQCPSNFMHRQDAGEEEKGQEKKKKGSIPESAIKHAGSPPGSLI